MSLQAKNITCCFGHGKNRSAVVDNLSLTVEPGELVALVGKKRSGKSTLLNVLAGLNRPTSGTCLIDNKEFIGGPLFRGAHARHTKIGVITKAPMLVSEYTVYENVMMPLHHQWFKSNKTKQKMAKEALRAVGLKGKGKFFPHELSVLEQQLVCTARAIVHHPAYLLVDEPTACLEGEEVEHYLDVLEVLCSAGYGILVGTYSKRVAGHCHRIVPITGEQIPATMSVDLNSRDDVTAVPGHTLAGTQPLAAVPEEESAADMTQMAVMQKDPLQAILDEQAEISAAEEAKDREAYEKDELQDYDFAEDNDAEFEQKLGSHIEDYMQEEKKEV